MNTDVIPWRGMSVAFEVALTPETSVFLLSAAQEERRTAEYLATDLWGPNLVDQYGRPI